jgi:hypothetical protein
VLDVVITDEAENTSLRKYGCVFIYRSITEVEDQPSCDDVTVNILCDVAGRNAHALLACVKRGSRAATSEDSGPG